MSDEYESSETGYSPFWPLLILLTGLVLWLGYQVFSINAQRSFLSQQIETAKPTIQAARNWQARYGSMMKDLSDTSKTDTYAAQVFKEALQAGVQSGLIQVNNNAPAGTNAAPANPAPDAAK